MRPLKFRAWSKTDKVMIYDLNCPRLVHGELKEEADDYIFMQYTGLKDKNGVEIYEGDIVNSIFEGKTVVVFSEEDCGFYPYALPSYGGFNYDYEIRDIAEIIGNIHLNPELLENK